MKIHGNIKISNKDSINYLNLKFIAFRKVLLVFQGYLRVSSPRSNSPAFPQHRILL